MNEYIRRCKVIVEVEVKVSFFHKIDTNFLHLNWYKIPGIITFWGKTGQDDRDNE